MNHLEVCPQLGRAIATHNSIRDALAHMVKQCGLADAAVVETPVTAADGDTTIADVVYFDSLSGERAILEVSVVTVGSDTSLARISRAGWTVSRRCCGRENKRNAAIASFRR